VRRLLLWLVVGTLIPTGWVSAQSGRTPQQAPVELQRLVDAYEHLLSDWAGLTRYGSEDSELGPPKPGETRVVFLGDDITEQWRTGNPPGFFPGTAYLNRGIAGQTTGQMLVRFRQDVVALRPRAVVIGGGSNDVAGAAGPASKATVMDNIMSMMEIAKANGIRVVLASVTPVCDCMTRQTLVRSQVRISDVNEVLKAYALASGAVYLDYYSALADGRSFKPELTKDGLLPNDAGYSVMARLAEQAIAQALNK
jgi:lysophospholipase L1-like esterase